MNFKKVFSIILIFTLLLLLTQLNVFCQKTEPNSMRIGVTVEPDSLSPLISYTQAGYEIFSVLYDSLVALDENYEAVPDLAKEWTISDDKLEWTFKLRNDVKWHDGVPFTSEDVKFSYELMLANQLGMYAGYLTGIDSVECPDDYTVIIKTLQPKANLLVLSALILPKHIWSKVSADEYETWPNENPVGTGPFKFGEFKAGEYIKLVANDDYFEVRPYIDELIYVFYANTNVMALSLKLREIDAATNFSANQLPFLKKNANLEVISAVSLGFTDISFNCWQDPASKGNPILMDKKVRQAIELCIDKQKILDMVYAGQGTVGTTLVPHEGFYHYEPAGNELRSYNLERAKKLLDDAGYKDNDGNGIREDANGNELNFVFTLRAENTDEIKAGQMISSMVKEAGINLEIETVDDGVLIDKIYSGDFDMFIWGWGADLDPTTILAVMSTDEIGNLSDCNYSNKEYDNLLVLQQTKMDPKERQQDVWKMQKILYEDAPYIILWYDNNLQAVNTENWTGWKRIPENGAFFFNLTTYNYKNVKPAAGKEK